MLRISSTYLAKGNFLCTFCKRWRRDERKFQVMSFTEDFSQRYITSCQNTVKWSMTRLPCLTNMRKASSYAASRMDLKHGKARSCRDGLGRQDGRNKAVVALFNPNDDGRMKESQATTIPARKRAAGQSIARRSQKLVQGSAPERLKTLENYGKTVKIKSNLKILSGEDDWDESEKMIAEAKFKAAGEEVAWSKATSDKAGKAFEEFQEMISVPESAELEQYLHEQSLRKKTKQAKKRSVNAFKVSDPYARRRLQKNRIKADFYNQSHLMTKEDPQCEFAEVQCGKKRLYIAYMEDALREKADAGTQVKPVKALQEEIMSLPAEKLRKMTPEKIAKMAQKKPVKEGMMVKMVQGKQENRVSPVNMKLPTKSNDFKVIVNLKNPRDDMCPLVHFEEKTPDGPVGQTMKFQVKKMEKYWFLTGNGRVRIQYLTGVLTNFRNRLKGKLEMPNLLKSPAGMPDQTKAVFYHNAEEGKPRGEETPRSLATPPPDENQKESLTKKLKLLTSSKKDSTDQKKEDYQSMFKMLRRKGKKTEDEKKEEQKAETPESGATKTLGSSIGKLMEGVVKPKTEHVKDAAVVRSKTPGLETPLKPAGETKEVMTLKPDVSKEVVTSEEMLLPPFKPKPNRTITPASKEIEKMNKEKQAEQSRIPIPVVTDPYFAQLCKQRGEETTMRRESQKLAQQGQQTQPVGVSPPYQAPAPSQIPQVQTPAPEPPFQQQASQSGSASGWVTPPEMPQPEQQSAPSQQLQGTYPNTNESSQGFLPQQTAQPPTAYQSNPHGQGYQDMQPQPTVQSQQGSPQQWMSQCSPYHMNPQQMPHPNQWQAPISQQPRPQNQDAQPTQEEIAQPEQQEKEAQPPTSNFYYPELGPKITRLVKKPPTAETTPTASFGSIFKEREPFIPIHVEVPPSFMHKDIHMYETQKELEETINKPVPEDDLPSGHLDNWKIPSLRKIVRANSSNAPHSVIIDSDSVGDCYAASSEYEPQTAMEYNYNYSQEPDLVTFERAVAQNFTRVDDADLMSIKEEHRKKPVEENSVMPVSPAQEKTPVVNMEVPDGVKPETADSRPGYLSYINQLPSYAQTAFENFHSIDVFDSKTLQNFVSYPLRMATAHWSTYHAAAEVPEIGPELTTDSETSRSVTFEERADNQMSEAKAPMAFVAGSSDPDGATTRMTKTKNSEPVQVSEPEKVKITGQSAQEQPKDRTSTRVESEIQNSDSKATEPRGPDSDNFNSGKRITRDVNGQHKKTAENASKITEKFGSDDNGAKTSEELLRKLKNELSAKLKDQWKVKFFDELTDRVKPVVENKLLPEKARRQLFLEKTSSASIMPKEKVPRKKQEEDDYHKKSSAIPLMTLTEPLIQQNLRLETLPAGEASAVNWTQQEGFSFQPEKKASEVPTAVSINLKVEKADKESDKQKTSDRNPEKASPVPHVPEKDHPYLPRKDLPGNPQKRETEAQPRQPKVFPHHKDHPYLPKFDQPPPKPYNPEQPHHSPASPYQPQTYPPSQPYYPYTQPSYPHEPSTSPPSQPYHPQTQPATSPCNPQTQPLSQPHQPQTQPTHQPQTYPQTQPYQPQTQPCYPQTPPGTHPNRPKRNPQKPSTPTYPRQQASDFERTFQPPEATQILPAKEPEQFQTAEQLAEQWVKYHEQFIQIAEKNGQGLTVETGKEHQAHQPEIHFIKDNIPSGKPEKEQKTAKQVTPGQNLTDKKEEEKKNLATIRPDKTGPAEFMKFKEDFRRIKEQEASKSGKTQEVATNKPMEAVAKASGDQTRIEKGKGDAASGKDQRKEGVSDKEETEKQRQERMEAKETEKRKQQELVAAQAMEMKLELVARKDRRVRDELEAKKRQEIRRQPTILGYGSIVTERPYQQASPVIHVPTDKKKEESKEKKPAQEEKKIQFPAPERPTVKSGAEETKPPDKTKTEESKPSAIQSKLLDVLLQKKPEKEKESPKASKTTGELIDFGRKPVADKKAGMGGEEKKESDKKEKLSPVREPERKVQGEADKLKIDEENKDKKTAKSDSNLGKAGDDKSGKGQPTETTAVKTSEKTKPEESVKRKSSISEWEKEIASKASSIFGLGSDKSKAEKAKKAGESEKSKSIQQEVKKPDEKKVQGEETGKGESTGRTRFFELPTLNPKDKKGGGQCGDKTPKMDARDDSVLMEARVEQYMKMYEPVTKVDGPGSSPMMGGGPRRDFFSAKTNDTGYYLPRTGSVTPKAVAHNMETINPDSKIRVVKIIFDDTKKDVDVIVEQGKKLEMDRREQEMRSSFETIKNLLKGAETEPKIAHPGAREEELLSEPSDADPYTQILRLAFDSENNKMKPQEEGKDSNRSSFVDLLKRTIVNAEKEIMVTEPSGVSTENFRSFLRLFRTAIESAEMELQKAASGKTGEGDMRGGRCAEVDVESFLDVVKDTVANAKGSGEKERGKRPPALDHIDVVREAKWDVSAMQNTEENKAEKVTMGFGGREKQREAAQERTGQESTKISAAADKTKIIDPKKPEVGFVAKGAAAGRRSDTTYVAPHLREVPEVSPKPKRESFMVSVSPTAERTVKEFVIREEPSEIETIPMGDEPKMTDPGNDPEMTCTQSSIRSARMDNNRTGKLPRTILPDIPKDGGKKPDAAVSSLIECKTAKDPPKKSSKEESRADKLRKALTEESSDAEPVSVAPGKGTSGTKKTTGMTQKRDLQTLATVMLKDAERYEPNRLIMRKLLGNREREVSTGEEEVEEKDDESPPSGDVDDALRHKIASGPYRKTELTNTEKEMTGIRDKIVQKTVRVFEVPPMEAHRKHILAAAKKASEIPCVMPIDPENPPEEPSNPSLPPPEDRKPKTKFWWQK